MYYVCSFPKKVVSEIVAATMIAVCGLKNSYRIVLKGERLVRRRIRRPSPIVEGYDALPRSFIRHVFRAGLKIAMRWEGRAKNAAQTGREARLRAYKTSQSVRQRIDDARTRAAEVRTKAHDQAQSLRDRAADVKKRADDVRVRAHDQAQLLRDRAADVKKRADDVRVRAHDQAQMMKEKAAEVREKAENVKARALNAKDRAVAVKDRMVEFKNRVKERISPTVKDSKKFCSSAKAPGLSLEDEPRRMLVRTRFDESKEASCSSDSGR